jgi:hypothetical protein
MAKKEFIKLTPEGLNLVTVLDYSSMSELNTFSGKEIFFSDKFAGEVSILFQCVGNLGAFARNNNLDKDISVLVISNKIIDDFYENITCDFIADLEGKLNQNNSPYRRIKFISEDHLIWYLENRAKITNSDQLSKLIKSYKDSRKIIGNSLF